MVTDQIKEKIEEQDMFGHVVNLNFDRKGNSHNTWIGGIFSILIKLFMVVFISLKFKRLIYRDGPNVAVAGLLVKVDLMGEVAWNETNLVSFFVMKH